MVAVTTRLPLWRDLTKAWRARSPRVDDTPDRSAELHAAALFRQYLSTSAILGSSVAICGAMIAIRPPSSVAASSAIVASLTIGYLLFLTELSTVPQTLRSIPALRSRELRRMQLATAALGTLETLLPTGLVLAIVVKLW